jgi:hypothetical protein
MEDLQFKYWEVVEKQIGAQEMLKKFAGGNNMKYPIERLQF